MPPKRKSQDTVSPDRPSKSRARPSRASKTSPNTDGNDSEALPTRPAKKGRGTALRTTRQDDDRDDDFGDSARSKPTTIEQHLMDQNKKSKEFIQHFKEQVTQGRETFQETVARLKQDLLKPRDDDDDCLAGIHAALRASTQPFSAKDHPLFEQTQQLLRLSHAILKCHQTVEKESRTADLTSPRETWKQDKEGMRKLLEYGKVYGEKVVEGWITPTTPQNGEQDPDDDDNEADDGEDSGEDREGMTEAENLAKGLFEWRRKGRGLLKAGEGWGVAARRQMVALAGVVRTLQPQESE
ncbi:uncharacterized protein B0T15DRAFT_536226 [Chaetomium strumarium]|uniref:Uncharacterized protein n=1 Tax=Chaetomium strumarium TaxID=1170767 RepID=A0AAJ0GQM3_9PEZI|nr:hypothetical protein B0T15DRAFT_536226 [Chaetomium strumarium]